jgi:hypothetical protein
MDKAASVGGSSIIMAPRKGRASWVEVPAGVGGNKGLQSRRDLGVGICRQLGYSVSKLRGCVP